MGHATKPGDGVDAAITKIEQAEQTVELQQVQLTIASTGRPAILAFPADITSDEIAEVAGWMLTALLAGKRAERQQPASRILVPNRPRVVRPA